MILRKLAVQAIDGRWLVDNKNSTYSWEYEKSLRTLFDSESEIITILNILGGCSDYDVITVLAIY